MAAALIGMVPVFSRLGSGFGLDFVDDFYDTSLLLVRRKIFPARQRREGYGLAFGELKAAILFTALARSEFLGTVEPIAHKRLVVEQGAAPTGRRSALSPRVAASRGASR